MTQAMKDRICELKREYYGRDLSQDSAEFGEEYIVEKILEEKEEEMKYKLNSIETDDSTQREYGLGVKSGLRQAIIILRN